MKAPFCLLGWGLKFSVYGCFVLSPAFPRNPSMDSCAHNHRKMLFTWSLPQIRPNEGARPTGMEMVPIHSLKQHVPLLQPQGSCLYHSTESNRAVGYLYTCTPSDFVSSFHHLAAFLKRHRFTRAFVFLLLAFKSPFVCN